MDHFHIQIETYQYESSVYSIIMDVCHNNDTYLSIRCYNFDDASLPQNISLVIVIYDIPAIQFGLLQCKKYYPHMEYVHITDKAFVVTSEKYREWISLNSYGILYHGKSWWEHWFGATLAEEDQCHTYNQLLSRLRDLHYKPPLGNFLGLLCPEPEDVPYFESVYKQYHILSDVFAHILHDRRVIFQEWKLCKFFQSFANFHTYQLSWKIPLTDLPVKIPNDSYPLIGPIETYVF